MGTLHQLRTWATDSLYNLVNGLGTTKDPRTHYQYSFTPMDRAQLESAYRSEWIARRVVDALAEDATREWREWQASQSQIEKLEEAEKAFDLKRQLRRALIKARLYGGAAIVMGVANQGLSEDPLDAEKVKQGDLKFLAVFHQFELTPGQRIRDINSPWFNQPEYYNLSTNVQNMDKDKLDGSVRIHPSRVIKLIGAELPDENTLLGANNVWGDSVLQAVDDALKATGTVIGGIAGMVGDAKMDVINIPGLTAKLADEEGSAQLIRRFTLANQAKSSINTLLLDEKEIWNRVTTSFAGMPDLIREFLSVASGAAGIPVSRLIGQAKGKGLGGTEGGGEVDTRNYYDSVSSVQRNEISPTLTPLDNVFIASTLGTSDPSIHYEWAPLWQLNDAEKASIASQKATAAQADVTMALINPDVLRKARINQLIEDGTYPGIEDAIDEFGEEPPEPVTPSPDDVQAHISMMQKSAGQLHKIGKAAALPPPSKVPTKDRRTVEDATPRSLYVRRDVLNAEAIIRWAKKNGFETTVPADQMHVTIMYSRTPLDWMKIGSDWSSSNSDVDGKVTIPAGGVRMLEQMGKAVALLFTDSNLKWRHETMKDAGAVTDYPDYQPHISLTFQPGSLDWHKVDAYRGPIVLGPEIFEETKEDESWRSTFKEDES